MLEAIEVNIASTKHHNWMNTFVPYTCFSLRLEHGPCQLAKDMEYDYDLEHQTEKNQLIHSASFY